MGKRLDLAGVRMGNLVAIRPAGYSDKNKNVMWVCRCDCGNEITVRAWHYLHGGMYSCGCSRATGVKKTRNDYGENRKHAKRLLGIWEAMKTRCYKNNGSYLYSRYGGRGIKVCDEWLDSFMNFFDWAMNNGYEENLTIDRVDVDGDYEPNNCRWATRSEQSNNTTTNRNITYKGETRTLAEWSRILDVPYGRLRARLKYGWSIERAFEQPACFVWGGKKK